MPSQLSTFKKRHLAKMADFIFYSFVHRLYVLPQITLSRKRVLALQTLLRSPIVVRFFLSHILFPLERIFLVSFFQMLVHMRRPRIDVAAQDAAVTFEWNNVASTTNSMNSFHVPPQIPILYTTITTQQTYTITSRLQSQRVFHFQFLHILANIFTVNGTS